MSGLSRFENKLEQLVSGVFARTFRSAVQPVEISAALNREVDNSAQILSRNRRLVPNSFQVELAPSDFEHLDGLGPQLLAELIDLLQDHASEQAYVFTGPVHVELETAEDLTTGRFRVRSSTVATVSGGTGMPAAVTPTPELTGPAAEPDQAPSAPPVRRAPVALLVNDVEHPLEPPGIVIGRGNDADLRINDPGVSRRHVEVRVIASATGPLVSVHDLGSTNGMLVNGRKVDQATVHDGSTIKIGNTTMTARIRRSG